MLNPLGYGFGEEPVLFYRGYAAAVFGMQHQCFIFSLCCVYKRPLIIDCSEYHNYCGETIIPLDGDILMHVAPATGDDQPPVDEIEVFHVPRGTMVVIKPRMASGCIL